MKGVLKLSYIKPSLWWDRKLAIGSSQWRALREVVLKRDGYQCYFCDIKATKYMVIDHINGDAQNNNLDNLRVLCPLCDTIRHSGLAGIMNTLRIVKTSLSQLEIIKKTQRHFLKNRTLITHRQMDPDSRLEKWMLPIDIATLEDEPEIEGFKNFKAVFTKEAIKQGRFRFMNFVSNV